VHGVCRLTSVADKLAKAGFTKKRGGTFLWGVNPEPWTFAFSVSPKMTGETSHAYQVERSKFDQILLDHARHMGVDVRDRLLRGRQAPARTELGQHLLRRLDSG
jgi:FAD-dependent halogenase